MWSSCRLSVEIANGLLIAVRSIWFKTNLSIFLDSKVRNIAILGSTGSIGTQTLDIVAEYPDRFRVSLLTGGRNWRLLAEQTRKFLPKRVVIADEEVYPELQKALDDLSVEILCGSQAIEDSVTESELDMIVTAMVGYSGLPATIKAVCAGKTICLANKETLVVAGELITGLADQHHATIIPVDSEHSAIFQCLQGEHQGYARKIILTASGGPFRTWSAESIRKATASEALRHPNWSMGSKVTVDSASMMNKGFEMIEARWLFDCPPEKIEVVVHPQSIVHSMVEFVDGSIKAQLGVTDMRLPIRYALGYPERLVSERQTLKLSQYSNLTFESPDFDRFPMLGYAFEAISTGGTAPCTLNAANEIAVGAFLKDEIYFGDIPRLVERTMSRVEVIQNPGYEDYVSVNELSRRKATEILSQIRQCH